MQMFRNIFILLSVFLCSLLIASETNKEEIVLAAENSIYQGKIECQDEFSVGIFQECWFTLLSNSQLVKNADIHINGGMPDHNHGLPTSPKMEWSLDKQAYLIEGLKFSMPGKWLLNFIISTNDDNLKDEITIAVEVN